MNNPTKEAPGSVYYGTCAHCNEEFKFRDWLVIERDGKIVHVRCHHKYVPNL